MQFADDSSRSRLQVSFYSRETDKTVDLWLQAKPEITAV
jgi:hypothetical protein